MHSLPKNRLARILLATSLSAMANAPGFNDRPVGAGGLDSSQTISVRTADGKVWARRWRSGQWESWVALASATGDSAYGAPWVEGFDGRGEFNIYALSRTATGDRLAQWIGDSSSFSVTAGLGQMDTLASAVSGSVFGQGNKAIFAVARDSAIRMRAWDSLQNTWGGWVSLGGSFAPLPPYAVVVDASDVNLYAVDAWGVIRQNWWNGVFWSGWVTPGTGTYTSSPAGLSFSNPDQALAVRQPSGRLGIRRWNGGSWSSTDTTGPIVASGVSAVVAGADSADFYGLTSRGRIVRVAWSAASRWTVLDSFALPDSGNAPPAPPVASGNGMTDRPVAVSGSGGLHHIAVRGRDGNIWVRDWVAASLVHRWTDWVSLEDLVLPEGGFTSSPWLQALNGAGFSNLFALGGKASSPHLAQWVGEDGGFVQSDGLDQNDSIATSVASAQVGSGHQSIFAIFADSSLRVRQWDSVSWTWSGWSVLGTGFSLLPPYATQVNDTQVNVYARKPDGTVSQNWWNGIFWSGWVYPAWQKTLSSPSSANFDATTHFLFAQGSDSVVVGAIWNGIYWTALPSSGVKTLSGVTPVVAGPDSLLVYGLAPNGNLIRFPWTSAHSWGSVEDLGPLPPATAALGERPTAGLAVGMHQEGNFLVLSPEMGLASGQLRVLDSRGRLVRTATWTAGTSRIPLVLKAGVYWVQAGGRALAFPVMR